MATVPPTRRIELAGVNALRTLLEDLDHVVHTVDGGADMGEDLIVDFTRGRKRTGRMIAVQVKTAGGRSSKYRRASGYAIPVGSHAGDWSTRPIPVIGVVYDMEAGRLFWVNLTKVLRAAPKPPRYVKVPFDAELSKETVEQFVAEIDAYARVMGTPDEERTPADSDGPTVKPSRARRVRLTTSWKNPSFTDQAHHPVWTQGSFIIWDHYRLTLIDGRTGKRQMGGIRTLLPHVPTAGDQALFLPAVPDRLKALNLPTLRLRWEVRLRVDPATMAFVEGVLYAPGQDGGLFALDPRSGAQRGPTLLPGQPILTQARIAACSLIVLAGPPAGQGSGTQQSKGCALALDPSDGEQRWVYEPRGLLLPHWAASDQMLYLLEEVESVQYLVAVHPTSGEESRRWKLAHGAAFPPVASSSAGHVLDRSGILQTYGSLPRRRRWSYRTRQRTPLAPVVARDLVLVVSAPHVLTALDAATGTERWCFEERGDFTTAPIVVEDIVYVAHRGGRLIALDLGTGVRLGSTPCHLWEEGERGQPTVAQGKLVFSGRYGVVHSVDLGLSDDGKIHRDHV
ncbi:PQQ-binding-like beta-propeller repeat protein [Streptomyces sp. NPDC006649]|uniref:outer membrane protein assembly factor BamB family protein n=1 Tax=Streptomyces sp. NPDC006649 TaxID=3156896 RepID=UPI0033A00ADB